MKNKEKKLGIRQVLSNFTYAFYLMIKIYPLKFVMQSSLTILGSVCNFFLFTYMIRFLINGIQSEKKFSVLLMHISVILIFVVLFFVLKRIYDTLIDPIISKKCDAKFNKTLFEKSMNSDISDFEDPSSYDLFTRAVTNGTGAVNATLNFVNEALDSTLKLFLTSWLFLQIDPILFIFALFPLAINFLNITAENIWYRYEKGEQKADRRIGYTKRVFYLADYAKEMRMSNIGNVMYERFKSAVNEFTDMVKTEGPKKAVIGFCIDFGVQGISTLGAELYALYRTLISGTMMFGDCLVVLNSTEEISWAVMNISQTFVNAYDIALHIQDYRSFISKEPEIKLNPKGKNAVAGDLCIKNISFKYNSSDSAVLKNITMTIRRGEKIAAVGKNGSGKTTLVKLILRLYDVSDGEILLGGSNIKEYNLNSYRSMYGAVFQDYHQLSLSVAENVLGRPYKSEDEETVVSALKNVGLWEIISELPNGIHTIIGHEFDDSGLILSRGQSQKLAIAAVYARNCEIVILDEPSSALDPIAEHELFEELNHACRDKTVIFISHRMSSVVNADRIFVLNKGRLAETGSHEELIRKNGIYAELFRMQAQNYITVRDCP